MQALAWLLGFCRERFESNRCVNDISQNFLRGIRISVQKERQRFVKHGANERWIAFDTRTHRLFKMTSQCHKSLTPLIFVTPCLLTPFVVGPERQRATNILLLSFLRPST